MTNRAQAPAIHTYRDLQLRRPVERILANGLPVYQLDEGNQEVVRIEVHFRAGRPYEKHPLVAFTANSLLKDGGGAFTSDSLSEHFDFYGATISQPFSLDACTAVLYCLNKHLPEVLPAFVEMLAQPEFRERELRALIKRRKQSLRRELRKGDVIAYRRLTADLFGEGHPYGYNSQPQAYDKLQREWIVEHHDRLFRAGNGRAIVTGRIDDATAKLIDRNLGQLPAGEAAPDPELTARPTIGEPRRIIRPKAGQTALRLGRPLFTRHHPDAPGLYVLNTLFGGYFGSRLMLNIREDKGYTYDIDASVETLRYDGYYYVSAEVGNEHIDATLREIHTEAERLRQDLVPDAELDMVRNYLTGTLLTSIDGPFNLATLYHNLLLENVPFEYFEQLVATVQEITPQTLRDLAGRYLNTEDYHTVLVGPGKQPK